MNKKKEIIQKEVKDFILRGMADALLNGFKKTGIFGGCFDEVDILDADTNEYLQLYNMIRGLLYGKRS